MIQIPAELARPFSVLLFRSEPGPMVVNDEDIQKIQEAAGLYRNLRSRLLGLGWDVEALNCLMTIGKMVLVADQTIQELIRHQ